MSEASTSETPLRTTFRIKLDGKTVLIATVGQAYQFLTNLKSAERMELRSLQDNALNSLQRAADDAMLSVQATNAVRELFVSARLL
jgi:hypothetical protein